MAFEGTIKYGTIQKDVADKKAKERKINLLLLVQHFLKSEGYVDSYICLLNESKMPESYEICDNMELNNILQDYETYYFIRFQKYPKISKKVCQSIDIPDKKSINKSKRPLIKDQKKEPVTDKNELPMSSLLSVHSVFHEDQFLTSREKNVFEDKLYKPIGSFEGYSDEWKSLAEIICKDIVEKDLNVKWDDVVGLNEAKLLLKEAIIYPMKYPELYKEMLSPWKGLLLYGPSGTGKTLLAKAVASECKTTFFNVSTSSIVSKWRGDSEKLIRVLFELARLQAPSTIFMDELDAVASCRGSTHEHEASRRLKSELLVQLDGLSQTTEDIFFLTTSNLPWDLDMAILRRLEKRIFVGLPELHDRTDLIKMYLPPVISSVPQCRSNLSYRTLAMECDGYTGADIKLICKEVKMAATRKLICELDKFENPHYYRGQFDLFELDTIRDKDFHSAKEKVKPSVANFLEKYLLWKNEFGS